MITRRSLADEIDLIEADIKVLNDSKRDCFNAYRDQMIGAGIAKPNIKAEIDAVKAAIKRRREAAKDEHALIEKDELIDEVFHEITRAPRAHVENIEEFDRDTGEVLDRDARRRERMSESMDDHKSLVDEMADAGLISEEARAENKALADAIAIKFGDGPVSAKPLQSPRKAAEAVSERTATGQAAGIAFGLSENSPETANEMQHPGSHLIGNPEPALAAANRPNGDDGMVRMARTEAAAVTDRRDDHLNSPSDDDAIAAVKGRARLANVGDVEPSSSAPIDPTEDRHEVQSLGLAAGANTGGDDVDRSAPRAGLTDQTSNIGEGERELIKALPGSITIEIDPPVPMKRSSFGHCFPELSKAAYDALAADIAADPCGVIEPIIRKGDVILDGWSRYNIARSLGLEYPVQEYAGSDELLDVIALQRSARDWTPAQEAKIAKLLAKELPDRAEDIWAAFHIVQLPDGEVVAA